MAIVSLTFSKLTFKKRIIKKELQQGRNNKKTYIEVYKKLKIIHSRNSQLLIKIRLIKIN